MKHKVLLTSIGLGAALLALSSYQNGPAHGGAGNRSGSAGSNGCSTAGCHGAESSSLALAFTLTDDANGTVVSDGKYEPGHSYTVTFTGVYSGSAAYTHLGFQASIVNASSANSGTITATAANTATIAIGGINLVEHTSPLPKTGSNFVSTFKWAAPAAGSGDARFFARMVANNHNGTPGDDTPNAIQATFSEKAGGTSIRSVNNNEVFRIFPNPVRDQLNIQLTRKTTGKYQASVTAADGRAVSIATPVFSGDVLTIDISGLAKGAYLLTLQDGDARQVSRFVKY